MNALQMRHVSKAYPGFALKDVSFSLPEGCIMGLIGENGAGKSTTIRLILNNIRRDAGTIQVLGRDNRDHFELTKQDIGVVLDEAYFPAVITARQVDAIMRHTYTRWDSSRFFGYIRRFSLPENQPFKSFSRGMKMKLAIAVALSHEARLLILDEATSGLNPVARDDILDMLIEYTRDEHHTVLISSHIVSDLEKLCDYILFLHKGQVVFCEEKDRLLEQYGMLHCSKETFSALDPAAVKGHRSSPYGVDVLAERSRLPAGFSSEAVSIEDIIVFISKGGKRI